jgi:uncharacterized iron-regulated protein
LLLFFKKEGLSCLLAAALCGCVAGPPPCAPAGAWVDAASGRPVADPVARVRAGDVVLLGEAHDRAEDHAWELAVIARVYAARPDLVLGFEMFPRASQPALDRWVAGGESEAAFLKDSRWAEVWGFPPELYMPIFRFARDHHVPMVALNVSHALVHQVAQGGWDSVPQAAREGVGRPAAPGDAYRARLEDAMAGHGGPKMTAARLAHFIEAQTVWDRAMAEAIAAQKGRTVVAIMGEGHVLFRDGVPHQLAALGHDGALVLVPQADRCAIAGAGAADAIYIE